MLSTGMNRVCYAPADEGKTGAGVKSPEVARGVSEILNAVGKVRELLNEAGKVPGDDKEVGGSGTRKTPGGTSYSINESLKQRMIDEDPYVFRVIEEGAGYLKEFSIKLDTYSLMRAITGRIDLEEATGALISNTSLKDKMFYFSEDYGLWEAIKGVIEKNIPEGKLREIYTNKLKDFKPSEAIISTLKEVGIEGEDINRYGVRDIELLLLY